MGRPTLAAQIAKAAAEGDMDKVKELASRLEKNDVKKPKAKPKAKIKQADKEIRVYEEDLVEIAPNPNESFIVSAKKNNHQQSYVDENGKEYVKSRVVPFKVVKNRKNTWKDDLNEESADIEFDKMVHKNGVAKKNYRPVQKKIKVTCTRCNEPKVIWEGEFFNKNNWACDRCLTRNKPG